MTHHRFPIPADHALIVLAHASGGLSALFAFDAHMQHHLAWLTEAAEAMGSDVAGEDDEMKDARAVANAQTEPIRALRTELAELAADAEEPLPFLPETLGPKELLFVEKSFKTGMTRHLLSAAESLAALRETLRDFARDGDECAGLAERIDAFVVAVRGG